MPKYIKETLKILSVTLSLALIPHLVLAAPSRFDKIIDTKIKSMTLEEKVGQLFMVGFPQKSLTPELQKFLSTYKPGSFLLFKRNIQSAEQIRALNADLYRSSFRFSKLPPLIAIDQEGGAVSRLPISPAPPNALAIGQTQSPLMAEEMGAVTGRFLREVGFNMNLAPVLDISDPFSGSFIGVRSFGSDPNMVKELGVAYSKGLLKARVIPTAKHFPGSGNLKADPHYKVVENRSSHGSLFSRDLEPYRGYSDLGPTVAVMLSHYIYPALDSNREPASFSKKIIKDILRTDLGYKGLVVTDDLQMQGSKQLLRPEVAALRALQAGADVVMLTYSFADQEKAFRFIQASVKKGDLAIAEVDEKLRRILTAKAFANLYRRNPKSPSLLEGTHLSSLDYRELESTILEKNLKSSLVPTTLPKKGFAQKRTTASTDSLCVLAPVKNFLESFTKASTRPAKTRLLLGNFQKSSVDQWLKNASCDRILFAVTGPRTAKLVKALSLDVHKRLVVINLGAPKLFPKSFKSSRVVNLYFNHQDSGSKVAEHLEEILSNSLSEIALR